MEPKIQEENFEERRANVRLSRVLAVSLDDREEASSCVAVDLSVSGFQIATRLKLEPGRLVNVRLHLAKTGEVRVRAQVIWSQEMDLGLHRIGFQIEEVSSEEDFRKLCAYVDREHLNAQGVPEGSNPVLGLSTQVSLRTMSDEDIDRFSALAEITETLNGSSSLRDALDRALKVAVEATGAERGMILTDLGGLDFETPVFHAKSDNQSRAFSRSVVDKVLESKKPLLSLDAQRDSRLADSSSLRVMGTRSVLCVPIQGGNQNFGTLYLDNSLRAGALNQSDLKLAKILASMAASAIERAESFAQLVQREKLATIGTLTASLLHELSNPLTSILGLGELIQGEVETELTELLIEETRRCEQLVSDLLRFSRKESVERTEVFLDEVVEAAIGAVSTEFRRNQVDLVKYVDKDSPPVWGNSSHLRQVVLNLLTNAAHALGQSPDGRVEVRVKGFEDWVLLVVADNGPGIPPNLINKVFDPFFTTKDKSQGTGLGLSIIARIVDEHGGSVTVENRDSGGALFQVKLPRARVANVG